MHYGILQLVGAYRNAISYTQTSSPLHPVGKSYSIDIEAEKTVFEQRNKSPTP